MIDAPGVDQHFARSVVYSDGIDFWLLDGALAVLGLVDGCGAHRAGVVVRRALATVSLYTAAAASKLPPAGIVDVLVSHADTLLARMATLLARSLGPPSPSGLADHSVDQWNQLGEAWMAHVVAQAHERRDTLGTVSAQVATAMLQQLAPLSSGSSFGFDVLLHHSQTLAELAGVLHAVGHPAAPLFMVAASTRSLPDSSVGIGGQLAAVVSVPMTTAPPTAVPPGRLPPTTALSGPGRSGLPTRRPGHDREPATTDPMLDSASNTGGKRKRGRPRKFSAAGKTAVQNDTVLDLGGASEFHQELHAPLAAVSSNQETSSGDKLTPRPDGIGDVLSARYRCFVDACSEQTVVSGGCFVDNVRRAWRTGARSLRSDAFDPVRTVVAILHQFAAHGELGARALAMTGFDHSCLEYLCALACGCSNHSTGLLATVCAPSRRCRLVQQDALGALACVSPHWLLTNLAARAVLPCLFHEIERPFDIRAIPMSLVYSLQTVLGLASRPANLRWLLELVPSGVLEKLAGLAIVGIPSADGVFGDSTVESSEHHDDCSSCDRPRLAHLALNAFHAFVSCISKSHDFTAEKKKVARRAFLACCSQSAIANLVLLLRTNCCAGCVCRRCTARLGRHGTKSVGLPCRRSNRFVCRSRQLAMDSLVILSIAGQAFSESPNGITASLTPFAEDLFHVTTHADFKEQSLFLLAKVGTEWQNVK